MAQQNDIKAIGLMQDRVTLQSPASLTTNTLGDQTIAWQDVATVWADVEEISGAEPWMSQQAQGDIACVVTLWFYAGLNSTWRLLFNGNTYNVVGCTNPDGRKRRHRLHCQQVAKP